jgi:hypothetical protein
MSTPPLKEYVLTLEVERPNRGQVLAATRSGVAPAAVETVLQVPTFYCLVTGLLLLDIAALFEWKEHLGEGLNRGQVQRKALAALADSLGPDVTAEALLSRDPRLPASAAERSLLAPSFFCAVVVGGGKTRGFGLDASGTKQRLLDAVRTLEMRVQCGLSPEPPQAGSDAATPAPTGLGGGEAARRGAGAPGRDLRGSESALWAAGAEEGGRHALQRHAARAARAAVGPRWTGGEARR